MLMHGPIGLVSLEVMAFANFTHNLCQGGRVELYVLCCCCTDQLR